MNKAGKMVVGLLMIFGAVSVSFGYGMFEKDEAMYQKLKAEMEKIEQGWYEGDQITCSYSEDGKVIIDSKYDFLYKEKWCELKNVLAFVDEYRKFDEKELEKNLKGLTKMRVFQAMMCLMN